MIKTKIYFLLKCTKGVFTVWDYVLDPVRERKKYEKLNYKVEEI